MTPLLRLYAWMSPRRRRQAWLLLALTLGGSLAELLTIGAAVVFLGFVAEGSPIGVPFVELIPVVPLELAAIGLAVAAILGASLRLMLMWRSQMLVWGLGHELATAIFARALRQPYVAYLQHNSSLTLGGLEKVRIVVSMFLSPLAQGVSALIIAAFVIGAMLLVAPAATLAGGAVAVATYLAISSVVNRRLRRNAEVIASSTNERSRVVQEGLGAIRDILLDRSQPFFEERYRQSDAANRRAQAQNAFIGAAPRFVIEGVAIAAIAMVVGFLGGEPDASFVPMLGVLAIGLQRLLPLLQQIYWSAASASGNMALLRDVMVLLDSPVIPDTAGPRGPGIKGDIALRDIRFSYGPGRGALNGVNLTIATGERVGLTGPSGSGKSTIIDLLLGLLEPDAGAVLVGGRALKAADHPRWQACIGHVPQNVYLIDESVTANICLGVEPKGIDHDRLRRLLDVVDLAELISDLPEGLQTRAGERGVRFSSGQKQRIGIARALYGDPDLLILDEATSALDQVAGRRILSAIAAMKPEMAILIVSHRRSAFTICDRVLEMDQLTETGSMEAEFQASR